MQSDVRLFFNNMADVWDSKEIRDEKWISNFITKYVPVSKGMRVLDIGCGTGIVSNILFEMSQTKVVGLDISESMIEIAKQKHQFLDIDFYSEDFFSTSKSGFDMIVCFNAYPHFIDVAKFKEQAVKCLNDFGYLVILHNLSREELSDCHKGLSDTISRDLQKINNEVEPYEDDFDIIELIDNNHMFMMLLQKKKGDL